MDEESRSGRGHGASRTKRPFRSFSVLPMFLCHTRCSAVCSRNTFGHARVERLRWDRRSRSARPRGRSDRHHETPPPPIDAQLPRTDASSGSRASCRYVSSRACSTRSVAEPSLTVGPCRRGSGAWSTPSSSAPPGIALRPGRSRPRPTRVLERAGSDRRDSRDAHERSVARTLRRDGPSVTVPPAK